MEVFMDDNVYCRKCGGKWEDRPNYTTSTTIRYVAESCGFCGTDFHVGKPTHKENLKKKDFNKKCIKQKETILKEWMGTLDGI